MTEIVFLVEDDRNGGYTAKALGESIFTQADDINALREMIRDAVHCHFPDEQSRPKIIRLQGAKVASRLRSMVEEHTAFNIAKHTQKLGLA